jgi:tetratricopeptide (TPR) repeat protein
MSPSPSLCKALVTGVVVGLCTFGSQVLAQQVTPSNPPAAAPEDPELKRATQFVRRGQPEQALPVIDKYLETHPGHLQGRFLRGLALTDLKRSDEAIQVFIGLTSEYPELPEPYNNLAVLYAADGRLDAARRALEQSIAANPKGFVAQENLGDLYLRLAATAYGKAAELDPKSRAVRAKLRLLEEIITPPPPAKP